MLGADRFYSRLGKTFEPGILTEVVLAAFELMKQGKRLISLTGGSYDPPSLPVGPVREVLEEAPVEAWREMLQYGSNMGSGALREGLARFMEGAGIRADPRTEVIVTTGSQQALDLASRLFIDPGDIIIVDSPTYLQALAAFKQFNPEFLSIPVDEEGMRLDLLERELRRLALEGRRPKLLYTVPSYHNPTTTVLSMERRRRILDLAEEYDFLILEDNPYGYISFEGPMPTPLKAMDRSGRVLYMSTFSKIISPGLRIGWIAARGEFIAKMAEAKSNIDICSDGLSQYVAAELLRRGFVERQIDHIIEVYRRKRDLMLEAMETRFPEGAEWAKPKGGLFIWVKMPRQVDTDEMLKEALKNGVAYIPGSNFFLDPNIRNYLRLNYSFPSEEDIVEGITILGRIFRGRL
ncbi:PLP-dependent aminotransferase family protein [Candidatus Bathyarchaeota archaeon]|nr:PLP-dependent aminotransferase family protein [Candidatus Bathyarchaeota archaeon]